MKIYHNNSNLEFQTVKVSRLSNVEAQGQAICPWALQEWGIDFWETYAPVVNWISVYLLPIKDILRGLEIKSLTFPQANLNKDVYMELPFGFQNG